MEKGNCPRGVKSTKKVLSLILLTILTFSVVFFIFEKPVKAESLILQPSRDDARIEQIEPEKNFGTLVELKVRSKNNENKRTFIKFDLSSIPQNVTIHQALLQLYLIDAPGSSRVYEIYRVLENWEERSITWNNQPQNITTIPTDSISYGGSGVPKNVWLSWNVTSDVIYFYNNQDQNFGWLIKDSQENETTGREAVFRSNNYTVDLSLRPKLIITYTINQPSEPTCNNNGVCEEGENSENCSNDCPPPQGPVCGNNICEENENCQNCPQDCPPQFNPSDIVINEFVSDPVDGEEEWIELYNNTEREVDLTGWKIEDGSGAITNLSGKIGPKDFFVVEKIKGYLNNSGDIIILKDPSGKIIDQVAYGDWDDGNKDDNAPGTRDPYSVARIIDGYDTDRDNLDFKISTTPTKGESNKISEEKTYPFGVILNEILPNPKGDDSENEFIELKNLTDKEIDLEGWKLEDAAGTKFVISSKNFSSTKIPGKGFFVIYRKDSKIALNNSGNETLKLYQPNDNLVDLLIYSGTVSEDVSYARDEKNNWAWTTQITPGQENVIKKLNQPPKAVISAKNKALVNEEIIFDASDSYDPDGDAISYSWDFGDGTKSQEILVKHIYKKAGQYNVKLEVKDSFGLTDSASLKIEILEGEKIISLSPVEAEILVTEFLPNPKGADDGEWIEIYNAGDKEIDLSGWFLDDADGGSKPYKIKEGTKILPGEYLVFYRKETKIALNNNFDSVRILDPEGNLFFEVSYEKTKEGFSYALDENGDWSWTSILTPGKKNVFSQEDEVKTKFKSSAEKEVILEIPLSEIRNQDLGDLVKVKGVVSVEPGVLGSQIFYLAGSGIQVYSYQKNFPNLKVGDYLEVIGELNEYKGELRIKVSSKEDIKVLETKPAPQPKEVKTGEIDEDLEGSLVMITGEVIERQSNYLYLDDGSGEVKVYFKKTTGIKRPKLKEGDWLKVVGIVSQYNEEYRILPRYQTDIELIKKPIKTDKFEAAGSLSETKPLFGKIDSFSKSEKIKYLFLSALTLLIILFSLFIKKIIKI
jgi:PKD repeat protein